MKGNRDYDEFIQHVRSESDILTTVSGYVSLKKKGNRYWGCCPFHNENTPSFSVVPDQGFFYCFGCHAGGNVFKFISLIENISYFEAVKLQAERLNIPMPQREKTEQEMLHEQKIADLRKVHEMARDFFHSCLMRTKYGVTAKEYLLQRGIKEEVIEEFRLGFAPPAWDKLLTAFKQRGIPESLLLEAGLIAQRSSGGFYDRFRNRVIIPICDERGRVVGFGGRVLDDSQPKYLNSPETLLFNKRKLLFGLEHAHKAIKEQGRAIVVEGYMDAISVYSQGVGNVVASLGTAFTTEQCKKLLRYAPAIYFAYDSDEAGQQATLRALSIVRETGANVKVIALPDGKDPDEFIRKHGAAEFRQVVEAALPLAEYRIKMALNTADYTALEGKVKVLTEILPVLAELHNAVELNAYVARISQVLSIDEGVIRGELQTFVGKNNRSAGGFSESPSMRVAVKRADTAILRAGRYIIKTIWQDVSILPYVQANLPAGAVENKLHGEILSFIVERVEEAAPIDDVVANQVLTPDAAAELSHCLVEDFGQEDQMQLFDDCIRTIRLAYLNRLYEEHRLRADELERRGDEGFIRELAESQRIKNEINEL
jgi:DNA primase